MLLLRVIRYVDARCHYFVMPCLRAAFAILRAYFLMPYIHTLPPRCGYFAYAAAMPRYAMRRDIADTFRR